MIRSVLALALSILALPALAQTEPPRTSSEVRTALAAALDKGDRVAVTRAAVTMALMGASLSDESMVRITPFLDPATINTINTMPWPADVRDPAFALRGWLKANGDAGPAGMSSHHASVPAEYRLVEGIAWDDTTSRLFIGTVVDGRLAYLVSDVWREIPLGSPRGGLFGMGIDPARRLLWIATGSVEQTAVKGKRMTGLIAVHLDRLEVVRRVRVPKGREGAEGDLTVAEDGTVYSSNSVTGAIHRCPPGCTMMETLVASGRFPNPQGLALSWSGKHLYVADYVTGLWTVELATGSVEALRTNVPAMLEGIDGLKINKRGLEERPHLVAIQNGTRPRRIVRIDLDPSGLVVEGTRAQLTFAPTAGEATLGAEFEGELYFIADGQWERYGPRGVLKVGGQLRPTQIDWIYYEDILLHPNHVGIGARSPAR